jgi:hypothetical protein
VMTLLEVHPLVLLQAICLHKMSKYLPSVGITLPCGCRYEGRVVAFHPERCAMSVWMEENSDHCSNAAR